MVYSLLLWATAAPTLSLLLSPPTSKTNLLRHFVFALKTIYSLGRFKKGVLIVWRQGPGIFVRAYSLIPLLLQPMPNFAKMQTSHDAHFIVIIFFLSTLSKWFYIHNRGQPHFSPTSHQQSLHDRIFHQHLGAVPKALHRKKKKRSVFISENWSMEKVLGSFWDFFCREGSRLSLEDAMFCCVLEIEDRGRRPRSMQMRPSEAGHG